MRVLKLPSERCLGVKEPLIEIPSACSHHGESSDLLCVNLVQNPGILDSEH